MLEPLQESMSARPVYEAYLKGLGYTYVGISNRRGSKRPKVSQFSKENNKGKYSAILQIM